MTIIECLKSSQDIRLICNGQELSWVDGQWVVTFYDGTAGVDRHVPIIQTEDENLAVAVLTGENIDGDTLCGCGDAKKLHTGKHGECRAGGCPCAGFTADEA